MRSKALRLLVGAAGRRLQFELTEPDAKDALARASLTLSELRLVLFDLEDVLTAATTGVSADRFAAVRADPERWDDHEVESEDVSRWKLDLATQRFDIADLQRRVWLKSSSKNQLPIKFSWEVAVKHADDERPLPGGGPVVFGTIRLASEPPDSGYSSPERAGDEVVVTVDKEDVGYMIDALVRLQRAMESADRMQEE